MTSKPTVLVPALSTPAEVDLRELATADSLLVALDFDGVLAPLQDDPETSQMTAGSAAAIAALARLPHTRVALVSGRDIATLSRLTETPESVWMIGSHGAEAALGSGIESDRAGIAPVGRDGADLAHGTGASHSPELTAAEQERLTAIDAHIEAFEDALPPTASEMLTDLLVELKPYSRTVHTRGFDPEVAAALHEHAMQVAEEFPDIRVIEGHDITELAVKQATKGDGLRLLARAGAPTAMAYLGDDVTDEDAFAALHDLSADQTLDSGPTDKTGQTDKTGLPDRTGLPDEAGPTLEAGLTVKVGTAPTQARWRITGPDAVADLLGRLAAERADHLGAERG
ncbi:trehalose-phosphatase [Brevibacterium oceani]|uniref:trehalose-phosphatase n=1 Tax=Brevibacterium oceani TaxID=358099 RepID=UPI001B34348F|nr:trehalose-phosphatase [Brevibacterium oceani]